MQRQRTRCCYSCECRQQARQKREIEARTAKKGGPAKPFVTSGLNKASIPDAWDEPDFHSPTKSIAALATPKHTPFGCVRDGCSM